MSRRVKVQCTFLVEVDVPDDWDRETTVFTIEENSCPYTGVVGSAVDARRAHAERTGTCACCPDGTNKIVEWLD